LICHQDGTADKLTEIHPLCKLIRKQSTESICTESRCSPYNRNYALRILSLSDLLNFIPALGPSQKLLELPVEDVAHLAARQRQCQMTMQIQRVNQSHLLPFGQSRCRFPQDQCSLIFRMLLVSMTPSQRNTR
jgi:hypothetical protein